MTAIASIGASAPMPFAASGARPSLRPPAEPQPAYVDEPLGEDPGAPSAAIDRDFTGWSPYAPAEITPAPQAPPVYVDEPLIDPNAPDEAVLAAGRAIRAAAEAASAEAAEPSTGTDVPVVYVDEPLIDPNAPDEALLAEARANRAAAGDFASIPWVERFGAGASRGADADEALSREKAVTALAARAPASLIAVSGLSSGPLALFSDTDAASTPPGSPLDIVLAGYIRH